MNGSYTSNNFIVRLRGLPWNTEQSEIYSFLQGLSLEFDRRVGKKRNPFQAVRFEMSSF